MPQILSKLFTLTEKGRSGFSKAEAMFVAEWYFTHATRNKINTGWTLEDVRWDQLFDSFYKKFLYTKKNPPKPTFGNFKFKVYQLSLSPNFSEEEAKELCTLIENQKLGNVEVVEKQSEIYEGNLVHSDGTPEWHNYCDGKTEYIKKMEDSPKYDKSWVVNRYCIAMSMFDKLFAKFEKLQQESSARIDLLDKDLSDAKEYVVLYEEETAKDTGFTKEEIRKYILQKQLGRRIEEMEHEETEREEEIRRLKESLEKQRHVIKLLEQRPEKSNGLVTFKHNNNVFEVPEQFAGNATYVSQVIKGMSEG